MDSQFTTNLGRADRIARAVVGLMLVISSSLVWVLPPATIGALCLLAVYPLMTAMIGWDPLLAAATRVYRKLRVSAHGTLPSRGAHA